MGGRPVDEPSFYERHFSDCRRERAFLNALKKLGLLPKALDRFA